MEKNLKTKGSKGRSTKNLLAKAEKQKERHNAVDTTLSVDDMTSREFQHDLNAHIDVASHLLKDEVCIGNFKAAILYNKHLFRGRTVLNIGCGIGILSLFAAKAGASCVYAVDSSNVVDYARRIVEDNGYVDVVHVIKGRIEDIELPCPHVDIIICNWLGYSLLFQSACDSVIFARDKWLKKGTGLIFPDIAKLFMTCIENDRRKNDHIEWWRDVYGFNMSCLRKFALSEPVYQKVYPEQVLSTQFCIKALNLNTAKKEDLKFRCKFMFEIQRSGRMDGIMTYFDVYFSKSHTPMGFSTDPWSPNTHWMQSVFFFDQSISVISGSVYYGGIEMHCDEQHDCDLNNMHMRLEMFSGDPMYLHLETEMCWQLKSNGANVALEDHIGPDVKEGNKSTKIESYTKAALKNNENNEIKSYTECVKNVNKNNRRTVNSCNGLKLQDAHKYSVDRRQQKQSRQRKLIWGIPHINSQ